MSGGASRRLIEAAWPDGEPLRVGLELSGGRLSRLVLAADPVRFLVGREGASPGDDNVFVTARRQIGEYLAGRRLRFELPLAPAGTVFQRSVWEELGRIEAGATVTYGELADRIGRPRAARAVGNAVGANPLPLLIPCHRVTAAGGLGGFGDQSPAALTLKRRLLEHEGGLAAGINGPF